MAYAISIAGGLIIIALDIWDMGYYVKNATVWMVKLYIIWSICVDISILTGLLYYFFFR